MKHRFVYAVRFGNYHPFEIDSLWFKESSAQKRADALGGMWYVQPMTVCEE